MSRQVMLSQSGEVKLAGFHFTTDSLDLNQNINGKDDDHKVSTVHILDTIDTDLHLCTCMHLFQDDILSLGMMVTKLAHGAAQYAPKLAATDKYAALNLKDTSRQFSQTFGDFVTTCLTTDPKQVSIAVGQLAS